MAGGLVLDQVRRTRRLPPPVDAFLAHPRAHEPQQNPLSSHGNGTHTIATARVQLYLPRARLGAKETVPVRALNASKPERVKAKDR